MSVPFVHLVGLIGEGLTLRPSSGGALGFVLGGLLCFVVFFFLAEHVFLHLDFFFGAEFVELFFGHRGVWVNVFCPEFVGLGGLFICVLAHVSFLCFRSRLGLDCLACL